MAPRRMDGFGGGRPAGGPAPQPAMRPRPASAPVGQRMAPAGGQRMAPAPSQRMAQPMPQRPMARPVAQRPVAGPQGAYHPGYEQEQYQQPVRGRGAAAQHGPVDGRDEASAPRRTAGWKVALQFVVGLLVIVGVAAAIVALYVRYYQ